MEKLHIKEERQDDDDPVVQEMPVYLSKGLLEKLYVFQYPLRSTAVSYEKTNILASRIKPKLQEVELEAEIPTRIPTFDKSKAEQIVLNCDGCNKHNNPDEHNFFQGDVMDKIVYTSTRAHLDPGRYAVGILSKNELHLNPVHGILHVKPAFQYLDKSDKNLKKMGKDAGTEADSGEEEAEPQQITVKFARSESDRSKKAREKSYGYLQKKNAEESWVQTEFHPLESEQSVMDRNRLLTDKPNEEVSTLTLAKNQYLGSLIGPSTEDDQEKSMSSFVSMSHLRKLPLGEQVRLLMISVKVASFGRLCSVLNMSSESQQQQLLRSIQQVAVLVQGNWVVKSDVLYPKDKMCGVTGISSEIISKARDHVLCLFTVDRILDRKSVTEATKIPTEDMKDILQSMATHRAPHGWEFALPYDQNFIKKHPEVVQRQDMLWKAKLNQLQAHSSLGNDFKAPKREPADSPSTKTNRKTRRRSRQDSCSSDSGNEKK